MSFLTNAWAKVISLFSKEKKSEVVDYYKNIEVEAKSEQNTSLYLPELNSNELIAPTQPVLSDVLDPAFTQAKFQPVFIDEIAFKKSAVKDLPAKKAPKAKTTAKAAPKKPAVKKTVKTTDKAAPKKRRTQAK